MIGIAGGAICSIALSQAGLIVSGGLLVSGVAAITSYIGLLAVNETVKKTSWFQRLTQSTASIADKAIDAQSKAAVETLQSGLLRQKSFMMRNQSLLSRVAGKYNEFAFLGRTIQWVTKQSANLPPNNDKA